MPSSGVYTYHDVTASEIEALRAIYSALSYAIRKHGDEVNQWVKDCIESYEKEFVQRSQWINPGYKHDAK